MTIIGLAIALITMIAALALKSGRMILSFTAAGGWVLTGVGAYVNSSATWDLYYCLFWLSMGLTIACALLPAILREKKEQEATLDDFEEENRELIADIESDEEDRMHFDRLFKRRKVKPKMSRFAKTGRSRI